MSDLAKRDENGEKGERRTDSILLNRFWVLKRSADVDGADFLVQVPADTLQELRDNARRIQTFGIVQAKFFEGTNEVKIQRHYVLDEGQPRADFFCMIHTDHDDEDVHYFFTAQDIVATLKPTPCGDFYSFRLSTARQYEAMRNLPRKRILDSIQSGMEATDRLRNRQFIQSLYAIHFQATRHFDEHPDFEYHLKEVDKVKVVLCRDLKNNQRYLLDMRRDLFENQGTYNWGHDGTSSKFLTACILAHHLDGEPPSEQQFDAVHNHLILTLPAGQEHVLTSRDIESALKDNYDRADTLVEKALMYLPPHDGWTGEMFRVDNLSGHKITVIDRYAQSFTLEIASEKTRTAVEQMFDLKRKSIDVASPDLLLGAYVVRDANLKISKIQWTDLMLYDN